MYTVRVRQRILRNVSAILEFFLDGHWFAPIQSATQNESKYDNEYLKEEKHKGTH